MKIKCEICKEEFDENSREYYLDDMRVCEFCYRESQETDGEYQQAKAEYFQSDIPTELTAREEDIMLECGLESWREERE